MTNDFHISSRIRIAFLCSFIVGFISAVVYGFNGTEVSTQALVASTDTTKSWPIDDIQGEPRSWDFNYQPKVEPAIYHTQELNQDIVICSRCGAACKVERWRSAPESPPKKVIKSDEYDGTISPVCVTLEMLYHVDHYNIQCTSCTYTRYFKKIVPGE